MLVVDELMINMCDFKGTVCECNFEAIWNELIESAQEAGKKPVDGVYFGFEFCANMLTKCRLEKIIEQIHFVKSKGMSVSWVIPPLHERYLEIYKGFLKQLFSKTEIDECVVNDFGTLHMLRRELNWEKTIVMGRLFDKSTREIRFDVREYPRINENERLFTRPGFCSQSMQAIAKSYQTNHFETDTLPNGVLDLKEWDNNMDISVHYPRILLSRASYCEFDAVKEERKQKFLFRTSCKGECCSYEKVIKAEDRSDIRKSGLAIMGFQKNPIEKVVTGRIRMVYSKG